MSNRNQNMSLIEQLRDFEARILRLETQDHKTRKNDIRLSDTVVTADSINDRLCLENLVTNKIVCIGEAVDAVDTGGIPQAMWSFSGELTTADADTFSAPFVSENETTAKQILIAQGCGESFLGDVLVCVEFCSVGIESRIVLGGLDQLIIKEINVPISINERIRAHLISTPASGASNISVFVRFGTPTVSLSSSDCLL